MSFMTSARDEQRRISASLTDPRVIDPRQELVRHREVRRRRRRVVAQWHSRRCQISPQSPGGVRRKANLIGRVLGFARCSSLEWTVEVSRLWRLQWRGKGPPLAWLLPRCAWGGDVRV